MLNISRALLLIAAITMAGAAFAADEPATDRLAISGAVEHALTFSADDLRQLPLQEVNEVRILNHKGDVVSALKNVKGVRLRDILDKAVIKAPEHNDVKKMVIIATASDDYKAVFSWNEIYNSPLGDGVLVIFEADGKALEDEGPLVTVSTMDIRTGSRHVKWLTGIEVRKITE
ncbi:MAG: molybdopterin-dependent oxidoreductase [Sphingomonadales bacterium]|nr:molybdopterin-dependent oxidoreductase [Sphingomonadales bacterium]